MREINEPDLKQVVGGAFALSPISSNNNSSTSAGVNASSSAQGQQVANAFSNAESISAPVANGGSISLAIGFASAMAF